MAKRPVKPVYEKSADGLLSREIKKGSGAPLDKILLVYDLHEDLDRRRNLSVLHGLLVNPVRDSGVFREITHLHREYLFEYGAPFWVSELLCECEHNRPDLVVFHIPFCFHEEVSDALKKIRDEYKIPVLGFTTDLITLLGGVYKKFKAHYDRYIESCTRTLSIDTADPGKYYNGSFITGFPVVDYGLFNPSAENRDTDVSFTGSIGQWAYFGNTSRLDYINYLIPRLEEAKVKTLFADSSGRAAPLEDYAKTINRSRMVINFSQATEGNRHMKGRVFETLGSGALLLEESGPDTHRFFEPGKDYVEFSSPAKLLEKIIYYSKHTEERGEIALRGHKKAVELYTSGNLLKYTLDELGIGAPVDGKDSYPDFLKLIKNISGGKETGGKTV